MVTNDRRFGTAILLGCRITAAFVNMGLPQCDSPTIKINRIKGGRGSVFYCSLTKSYFTAERIKSFSNPILLNANNRLS